MSEDQCLAPRAADGRALRVRQLLYAARIVDRETFLERRSRLEEGDLADRGSDAIWIDAELAYYQGHYAECFERYSAWEANDGHARPSWMRLIAAVRRANAARHLGRVSVAREFRDAAIRMLGQDETLEYYESDVEAAHAHIVEIDGSSELARGCFLVAYRLARRHGRWARAASTASDLGRLHAELGRIAEAIEWQWRAKALLRRGRNEYTKRTVLVRLAKLDRAVRRTSAARRRLRGLWNRMIGDESTIGARIATALAYHELVLVHYSRPQESATRRTRRYRLARAWLARAESLAHAFGYAWERIYLQRDRTRLALTEYHEADDAKESARVVRNLLAIARGEFRKTVEMLTELDEQPKRMLLNVAEDVIHSPELLPLVDGERAEEFARSAGRAHRQLRKLMRPRVHGQAASLVARRLAARELLDQLLTIFNRRIILLDIEVEELSGVIWRTGKPTRNKVSPRLLTLLRFIDGHRSSGVVPERCSAHLGIAREQIYGYAKRLRDAIGATNLDPIPVNGKAKLYRLRYR